MVSQNYSIQQLLTLATYLSHFEVKKKQVFYAPLCIWYMFFEHFLLVNIGSQIVCLPYFVLYKTKRFQTHFFIFFSGLPTRLYNTQ